MIKEHGVYKFVEKDTKNIVYIGKTNSSFKQRIDAHIRATGGDEKFKEYVHKCDVYIAELPNSTETDLLERALINKYKPILNGTDNHKGMSDLIKISEPKWEKYITKIKPIKKKKKKENYYDETIWDYVFTSKIGTENNIDIYISQSRGFANFSSADEAFDYLNEIVYVCKKYGKEHCGYIRVSGKHIYQMKTLNRIYGRNPQYETLLGIYSRHIRHDRIMPHFISRALELENVPNSYERKIKYLFFSPFIIEFLDDCINGK